MKTQKRDLIIIGFGPAGLAAAVQAHLAGAERIEVIDPSSEIGSGGLSGIEILSNSPGKDFVEEYEAGYTVVLDLPEAVPLLDNRSPIALSLATPFLRSVANCVVTNGAVNHTAEKAIKIKITKTGYIVQTPSGAFEAPNLVLSPGGHEEIIPELSDRNPQLVFTSKEILSGSRAEELKAILYRRPNAAVVGNSHGAYSVADVLLSADVAADVDIYKQSPTKPFFESVEEAEAHGYPIAARDSICPETGRINRYDGIRGSARTLWLQEQRGGHKTHLRSNLNVPVQEIDANVPIIQATGYSPRRLSLFDESGQPIEYGTRKTPDGYATVRVKGSELPGVVALGIGHSSRDGTNVYHGQARKALALAR